MATTPEPTCFLPSSARLRRSLTSMPSTARASSFTSPMVRTPSAAARCAPPPMASRFLASASSRSSFFRSSSNAATRAGSSSSGAFSSADGGLGEPDALFAALRAALPVSASMRRTPAATPLSRHRRDQADVAGTPHMGAAAQLDRPAERVAGSPRPSRRRAPRRRISRRTAHGRPRRARRRAPSAAW